MEASARFKQVYENNPNFRYVGSKMIRDADTGKFFLSVMDEARLCGANYGNNYGKYLKGKRLTVFG